MKFLGRYSDVAYALMRMVLAFLFMSHGYQRVFTGPIFPPDFPPLGVANVLEVILGPLLFLGLLTPIAAFIASGEMAVAYFLAHVPRGGCCPSTTWARSPSPCVSASCTSPRAAAAATVSTR